MGSTTADRTVNIRGGAMRTGGFMPALSVSLSSCGRLWIPPMLHPMQRSLSRDYFLLYTRWEDVERSWVRSPFVSIICEYVIGLVCDRGRRSSIICDYICMRLGMEVKKNKIKKGRTIRCPPSWSWSRRGLKRKWKRKRKRKREWDKIYNRG
jgi:DNA-directed RNA polymerase subunit RPC12/RpoP